uniref:Uncharacterized protein n=1 Tax=Nelumbo nucifera TaxID=4432 RepID=A0A822Z0G8_NELNU|nr:TPA_asm: hypothetical protein HUJ06_008891 [Nelumbo nucifera]
MILIPRRLPRPKPMNLKDYRPKLTVLCLDTETGSSVAGDERRWKLGGKDTFVFLTPSNSNSSKMKKKDDKPEKPKVSKERRNSTDVKVAGKSKAKGVTEAVSAHEIHYVKK